MKGDDMPTIMVVEDIKSNMYLIDFILKNAGYEVIQAWTGEEGVELAIKKHPDLILMDIQLPGMDGLEAVKRIRASKADGSIPIIALTSFAMTGDRERAIAAGCTGYIEKPINTATILSEIEKFMPKETT